MATSSLPGIYFQENHALDTTIRMDSSCVAGFVGIAERGVVNQALRCRDFNEYVAAFGGFEGPGHLAHAVYGFFNSGGKECVVVRVLHQAAESGAAAAGLDIPGKKGLPAFRVSARSMGTWGNRLSFKLWHAVADRFNAQEKPGSGVGLLVENAAKRLRTGDFIRLQADGQIVTRRITVAGEAEISLDKPIDGLAEHLANGVRFELLALNISIGNGRKSEEYLGVAANPAREDYFLKVVNRRSSQVEIEQNGPAVRLPAEIGTCSLTGGHDGLVALEAGDFIGTYSGAGQGAGLGLFESFRDVSLICVPDTDIFHTVKNEAEALKSTRAVHEAMIDQATRIPKRFAILDAPDLKEPLELVNWVKSYDTMFAALYYPQVTIIDPCDVWGINTVRVPCSGHMAGIYAATDAQEGAMRAPANKFLPGVVGLASDLDLGLTEYLYQNRINTMKLVPGCGVKVWGAKTLSSDPEWRFINVRRAFSTISAALKNGTGWAVFEPHDTSLRKRVIRSVTAFLIDLWRKGYLVGKTPEEAFFVQCDSELNPPENVDNGLLVTRIGVALSKPTEFIMIHIEAEREGSNVVIEEN